MRFSLEDARYAAASALKRCIEESELPVPPPMDMVALQRGEGWLRCNHVDPSRAVISMIPLAALARHESHSACDAMQD